MLTSDTSPDRGEVRQRLVKRRPPLKFQNLITSTESSSSSEGEMISTLTVPVLVGSSQPSRATRGSAAYDLQAAQSVVLHPGTMTKVDVNVSLSLPSGYYMQLHSRSGLASQGIFTVGGVVDSD